MEIIDTHVHFWDPRSTPRAVSPLVRYLGFHEGLVDWLASKLTPQDVLNFYASTENITRKYLPSSIAEDHYDHHVSGIVHVEAGWEGNDERSCVDETTWVEGLRTSPDSHIAAIVGRVKLDLGVEVREILEQHISSSSRLRGVREVLFWHQDPRIMNGAQFAEQSRKSSWREGFEQLAEFGLHFEATIYSSQLLELAELAAAYPDQPIVLCHLGIPVACGGPFLGIGTSKSERSERFRRWADGMLALASNKNVHVKLSGLSMPVVGFGYEERVQRPSFEEVSENMIQFISTAVECFGVNRCMFGSNYPIDRVALNYGVLVDSLKHVLNTLEVSDIDAIFRANAHRFYRL